MWITNSGTWRRERIYLGGFEIWRKYNLESGNWVLKDERETVHISDDHRRICMIESLTWDDGDEIADIDVVPRRRFQFDNHLGTACVETDETGAVISYEEYHPYGTSSYRSWKSGVEVSAKRYRYTGKERDEETSLYYHGARYYAPWLGRWMSADPAGTVDGSNLFAYVRGSPVVMSDPSGMAGTGWTTDFSRAHPEPAADAAPRVSGPPPVRYPAPKPEPSEEAAGATLTESSLDRPPPEPKGEPATGVGIEPLGGGHVNDGSGGGPVVPPSAALGGGPEGTHEAARQAFDPGAVEERVQTVVSIWQLWAARAQIAAAWTFQSIFVPEEAWNQPPSAEPTGEDSLKEKAKELQRPSGTVLTRLPRKDGYWEGKPGEGKWHSENPDVNEITGGQPVVFKKGRPCALAVAPPPGAHAAPPGGARGAAASRRSVSRRRTRSGAARSGEGRTPRGDARARRRA